MDFDIGMAHNEIISFPEVVETHEWEILLDTTYHGGGEGLVVKCKGNLIMIIIYSTLSPCYQFI